MSAASSSAASSGTLAEAMVALAAAGKDHVARQALIAAETTAAKAVIAGLKEEHSGKRGRYESSDKKKLDKADETLKYNRDGLTLAEGREMARAENRRRHAAVAARKQAVVEVKHHAVAVDARARQQSAAASSAAATARPAAATARRAGDKDPPDDNENDALPEEIDTRYFCASEVQRNFNSWAQDEAKARRGGENLGGGFWRYTPKHFVELGGPWAVG